MEQLVEHENLCFTEEVTWVHLLCADFSWRSAFTIDPNYQIKVWGNFTKTALSIHIDGGMRLSRIHIWGGRTKPRHNYG